MGLWIYGSNMSLSWHSSLNVTTTGLAPFFFCISLFPSAPPRLWLRSRPRTLIGSKRTWRQTGRVPAVPRSTLSCQACQESIHTGNTWRNPRCSVSGRLRTRRVMSVIPPRNASVSAELMCRGESAALRKKAHCAPLFPSSDHVPKIVPVLPHRCGHLRFASSSCLLPHLPCDVRRVSRLVLVHTLIFLFRRVSAACHRNVA